MPATLRSLLVVASLATLVTPLLAAPVPGDTAFAPVPPMPAGDGPWVVRASYASKAQLDAVAGFVEPWEVHLREGYLVAAVDGAELREMIALGLTVHIDLRRTAKLLEPSRMLPGQDAGIPGYPCYRTVEETLADAAALAQANPGLAELVDAGDSWEKSQASGGYDLLVLRLTNESIPGPKPALFVMGAIHAREYATAELVTRFGEKLVQDYGTDPDVTWVLDHHEVHLLLHTNPDGRKMAEGGQYWRKNTNDGFCGGSDRGIDLNRNFDYQWGCCGGSSGNGCAETFRGPSPASEPETQAVEAYIRSIFPDQAGPDVPDDATGVFIDVHSYGEWVLWPWGYTQTPSPNGDALTTFGRKMAYLNDYFPMQAIDLYVTDGTTDDFAYGDLGVAAYCIEVGNDFFQDCGTFQNAILPDNIATLMYAAKVARTPYLTPSGPDTLSVVATPAVVEQGDPISLTASVSDSRFSNVNGTETTQNVTGASYWIDVPPWSSPGSGLPLQAVDGAFDARTEAVTATLDTSALSEGRHIVYIHGVDTSGQPGAESAVFIDVQVSQTTATITGTVTESASAAPLVATITAGAFTTTSDAAGAYSLLVPAGSYDVAAASPGHAARTRPGVQANAGQTVVVDIDLPVLVDHVSGQGHGQANPNEVKVHDAQGMPTAVDFQAYQAGSFGVNVATAVLEAPAHAQIVTGPGPGPVFGPQVRAFRRDATPLPGVNFYAYGTLKYGVNPGASALDAGARDELLTGAGPGAVFGPHVRGFRFDGLAVTPMPGVTFYAYATLKYGVNVSSGNLDADAAGELLTGAGPSPVFAPTVRGFDYSGSGITALAKVAFDAFPSPQFGVLPAGGDVDADAFAEIAAAPGPGPTLPARVRGWDYDGAAIVALPGFDLVAFPTLFGGRLAVGDVDLDVDGRAELLAGPGPDPAASAQVVTFAYDGAGLTPLVSFTPFTTAHGVAVGAGALGY